MLGTGKTLQCPGVGLGICRKITNCSLLSCVCWSKSHYLKLCVFVSPLYSRYGLNGNAGDDAKSDAEQMISKLKAINTERSRFA